MRRVLAVVCGMLAAGCGSSSRGEVLTMWLVGSEAQARTINELAGDFMQRTGMKVRCEAISWGEAHSKYLTAVAGEVEPDIGTMGLTWGVEFGRLGALVDFAQAHPEDIAAIRQATFPGLWASIEKDGQVYGLPFDVSLQILYYRTDFIPEPPETWEELAGVLDRLAADDRRMIIDWGNLSWIGYAPFLWQAGGDFYDGGKAATLRSPAAVRALEFFRDLYAEHGVPKTSVPMEQGMRTGEFPLAISGNWKMISLTEGLPELAGQWTIGPLPRGPAGKRTAFLGGRIMSVFARSTRQEAAWAFVKYLFEPEVQAKLYEAGLQTQDAYLPTNLATWDRLPMEASVRTTLLAQAQDAQGPPAVTGWTETTHELEAAIQRVILQGADPKAELAKVNDALTKSH